MSRTELRETVGLVAVVASLVFVGLEIRQNTAVARGQARQNLADLNQEWLRLSTAMAFRPVQRFEPLGSGNSGPTRTERMTLTLFAIL